MLHAAAAARVAQPYNLLLGAVTCGKAAAALRFYLGNKHSVSASRAQFCMSRTGILLVLQEQVAGLQACRHAMACAQPLCGSATGYAVFEMP
jgi:hypothetical protein